MSEYKFVLLAAKTDQRRFPYVLEISDKPLLHHPQQRTVFQLQYDAEDLPEDCVVGADAVQVACADESEEGDLWHFQECDFRFIATSAIDYAYDLDIRDLNMMYELNQCSIEDLKLSESLYKSQATVDVKKFYSKRLKPRIVIKERLDVILQQSTTLHALIGSEETKAYKALLFLSYHEVRVAMNLVFEVSNNYGSKGLTLLEQYFSEGLHLREEHTYLVLPPVSDFEPKKLSVVK